MIFPVLKLEKVVQVEDQTRLDASKSYTTPDESSITLIEIEPEAAAGYFDVTAQQFLDYQYSTDGTKSVSLRVTTDGAPQTLSFSLEVISEADDMLFSGDDELTSHESDILEYVKPGRNSFLNFHRNAQDRIITWLDEQRITDNNGDRLTKAAIVDHEEVNDWSKFLTLRLIFASLSNSVDDLFQDKSREYKALEGIARNRSQLRLDKDGDGITDTTASDTRSFRLVRK